MCGRREAGEARKKILRWKSFAPHETFPMCAGYAKESNPRHPCHAHKHDGKERAQCSTPSPRDGTFRREDDFIRALVPPAVQPA